MSNEVKKLGTPTLYKIEYNEQARKLCLLGYTDSQLADFFNVCVNTIDNWKNKYPDFLGSIKKGKEVADSEVADSLYNRAKGMSIKEEKISEGSIVELRREIPPDTAAAFIWLKNRQSKNWRDKTEVAVDSNVTAQVDLKGDINVMGVIDGFKRDFLDEGE